MHSLINSSYQMYSLMKSGIKIMMYLLVESGDQIYLLMVTGNQM